MRVHVLSTLPKALRVPVVQDQRSVVLRAGMGRPTVALCAPENQTCSMRVTRQSASIYRLDATAIVWRLDHGNSPASMSDLRTSSYAG